MADKIVFNREELYERIWTVPIVRLSKEFGISDVALAKICKKLMVPRPPRGYWEKLKANKKVYRPQLPSASPGVPIEHVHYPYEKPAYQVSIDPGTKKGINLNREIVIRANLDNAHRLVKESQSVLERAKPAENGLLINHQRTCLDLRVSSGCLDRALRIMEAIILQFESEGYKVAIKKDEKKSTFVSIENEEIEFSIIEDYRRIDHILTKEEEAKKKAYSYWDFKRYDYHLTGELSLKIENSGAYGCRKKWSDSKTGKLEGKVVDFIVGAILFAYTLKAERHKREEDHKRWEEERRKREEEEKRLAEESARIQELKKQAACWVNSEQIRRFVSAVEKAIAGRDFSEEKISGIGAWMAWARKQADQMDPIKLSFPE